MFKLHCLTTIPFLLLLVAAAANATNYGNHHNHNIDFENFNENHNTNHYDGRTDTQIYTINPAPAATDHYGRGVGCSKPTLWGGLLGGSDATVGYVGITVPLSSGECKSAIRRARTLQENEISIQRGQLAEMCNRLHKTVWSSDSELHRVCDQFQPTHGHGPTTKAKCGPNCQKQRRVSGH